MGLLMEAIRRTTDPTTPLSRVFFEGQFSSYAYAEDGASLYDLLHLMNQEKHLIKDPLIAGMNHLYELEAYLETAEDHTLRMMLNMVLEYGNALPGLLQQLRNKQVPPAEKHTAEMIFSTAHRCKGMEYDEVTLLPDFISEDKLEKLKRDVLLNPLQLMRLEEEINLLYVAITRCRERLYLPELLLPQSFHPGPSITVLKTVLPATPSVVLPPEPMSRPLKQKWQQEELRYTLPDMHQVSPNPIKNPPRWTARQDELLLSLFRAGQSTPAMAKQLRRSKDAVRQRLKKLLNAIG